MSFSKRDLDTACTIFAATITAPISLPIIALYAAVHAYQNHKEHKEERQGGGHSLHLHSFFHRNDQSNFSTVSCDNTCSTSSSDTPRYYPAGLPEY